MAGDDFAATEQYISNLKNVFDQSVNLYWQLMSREDGHREEAKENLILNRFHELFGHMKNQLGVFRFLSLLVSILILVRFIFLFFIVC
jgi:hypothetical protein